MPGTQPNAAAAPSVCPALHQALGVDRDMAANRSTWPTARLMHHRMSAMLAGGLPRPSQGTLAELGPSRVSGTTRTDRADVASPNAGRGSHPARRTTSTPPATAGWATAATGVPAGRCPSAADARPCRTRRRTLTRTSTRLGPLRGRRPA